jgi:hypothetical protein
MPLQSAFTISATNPHHIGYDPASPNSPYLRASLYSFGGFTHSHLGGLTLSDQVATDTLIVGRDVADPADENNITDYATDIYHYSSFLVAVSGGGLTTDNQYLLVFGLKRPALSYSPVAQFFVGTEWVRSVSIDDDEETVALLIDTPDSAYGWVAVYVRLASDVAVDLLGLTGVEGYLL